MPGAALAVLATSAKVPLSLTGGERVGVAICGGVSSCSVAICGIANLKHRLCGKDYVHTDLAQGEHLIGKDTRCRYFKNDKLIGMGKVNFDGKQFELAFLPKRFNIVSLKYMTVVREGKFIILRSTNKGAKDRKVFEFADEEEAKAWKVVLSKCAKEVTAAAYSNETEDKFKELAMQMESFEGIGQGQGRYGVKANDEAMTSYFACCLSRAPQQV